MVSLRRVGNGSLADRREQCSRRTGETHQDPSWPGPDGPSMVLLDGHGQGIANRRLSKVVNPDLDRLTSAHHLRDQLQVSIDLIRHVVHDTVVAKTSDGRQARAVRSKGCGRLLTIRVDLGRDRRPFRSTDRCSPDARRRERRVRPCLAHLAGQRGGRVSQSRRASRIWAYAIVTFART